MPTAPDPTQMSPATLILVAIAVISTGLAIIEWGRRRRFQRRLLRLRERVESLRHPSGEMPILPPPRRSGEQAMIEDLLKREMAYTAELTLAQEVQRRLLPRHFPFADHVRFATGYDACTQVGGDLFGAFPVTNRVVGFYIADACGHGVSAALMTAVVKTTLEMQGATLASVVGTEGGGAALLDARNTGERLRGLMGALNASLHRVCPPGSFVTLLIGVLDMVTGEVQLATAGHPGPLVWRAATRQLQQIDPPSNVPLGLDDPMEFETTELHLKPGDRLVLLTDGIVERTNRAGEHFGWDRTRDLIAAAPPPATPDDWVASVSDALREFGEGTANPDDQAMMVVEWTLPMRDRS
jgi:sigma-B regulation protein RsbU (phosphoserine phosphatase)